MFRSLLALILLAGPALADTTVPVQPPAYIVTPPKTTGPYRVTPLPFTLNIPDPAGLVALQGRVDALEAAISALKPTSSAPVTPTPPVITPVATTPPSVTPSTIPTAQSPDGTPCPAVPASALSGTTLRLTVGPSQVFKQLSCALIAGRDAAITDAFITVTPVPSDPGYYVNMESRGVSPVSGRGFYGDVDFNLTLDTVPMLGANGKRLLVRLSATGADQFYYRKGILVPHRDLTMRGFECDGGPQGNSYQLACIRPEATAGRAQNILVEDNEFHHFANGNLGTYADGTWIGRRNYYHDTGTGNGLEHGIYVATIGSILSEDELYVRTNVGHGFKTRAHTITMNRGRIFDLDTGRSSYGFNAPEGGVITINDTIIQRGALASNGPAIATGEEIIRDACPGVQTPGKPLCYVPDDGRPRSIALKNLTILSNAPTDTPFLGTLGMWNALNVPVTAVGTRFYGAGARLTQMTTDAGTVAWPGDVTMLNAMPALDTSSPVFSK